MIPGVLKWFRLRPVPFDRTDPEPLSRLDRLDGLDSRRPASRPTYSPTPLFDETVLATGVLPEGVAA